MADGLFGKMKISILSPFSAVEAYTKPLIVVAGALTRAGHQVSWLFCDRAMKSGCVAMRALNLSEKSSEIEKEKICSICIKNSKTIEAVTKLPSFWFSENDKSVKSINTIVRESSSHDIILNKKIFSNKSLKKEINQNKTRLSEFQKIYFAAKKTKCLTQSNIILTYNFNYSFNQLIAKIYKKKASIVSIHHSLHAAEKNFYIFYKGFSFDFFTNLAKAFSPKNIKLSVFDLLKIKQHEKALFKSLVPWAYSKPFAPATTLHEKLGYKKKILILMSSPDENFSAEYSKIVSFNFEENLFSDQIKWLKYLFMLSKKMTKYLFYVRPHPRFFPNAREKQNSELGRKMMRLRIQLASKNFVWSKIEKQESVWSHLKTTDLVLNAWSSVGDEFSKKGIPVISAFKGYCFQRQMDLFPASKSDYKKSIIKTLQGDKKPDNMYLFYRWQKHLFSFNKCKILTKPSFFYKLWKFHKIKLGQKKTFFCLFKKSQNDKKIVKLILKEAAYK